MILSDSRHGIIYFDGVCNLCNGLVQFIIRHDPNHVFLFASLQSDAGKKAIKEMNAAGLETIILEYNGAYYTKSDAVIHIARRLKGWSKILSAGVIVPRYVRNGIYNWVARNRYNWFGKRNECMMTTPDLQKRFLP